MAAMVPSRRNRLNPIQDAIRVRLRALRHLARPMAWALALWLVAVALPFAWLYPGERLSRPICLFLVVLPPLATFAVATSGQARTLLVTGLASLVPPLVACPELLSVRVTGALQGLAVAGVLLSFIASAVDADQPGDWAPLRRLLRPSADWLVPAMGAVWLALAWLPGGERTARVALVATTWMAVQLLPLGAKPVGRPTAAWWLSRGGLAAVLLALWGWWA